jgi:hypothetical protein
MTLHLVPILDTKPARRRRIRSGDARLVMGLRLMLDAATDPTRRDALAVDPGDVADIRAALAPRATFRTREGALLALAKLATDWTATEQGRDEMRRLLAYIAPALDLESYLWAEIVGDLDISNDEQFNIDARGAAEANLFCNLAAALGAPTGPGAA